MVQVKTICWSLNLWVPALAQAINKAIGLKAVKVLAIAAETQIEHLSAWL
jgi:hypothetical protein